jgi:hypothetical protein
LSAAQPRVLGSDAARAGGRLPDRITLVAGAGRSGTTWLAKLLDASPEVFYKHEPDNFVALPFLRGIPSRLDPGPANARWALPFRRGLERACWTHALHFFRPPEFPKPFLRPGPMAVANLGLRLAGRLGVEGRALLPLGPWALRGGLGGVQLVWKSVISNLRLAFLHEVFPDMRIVLIVRHPGAYVASWLRGQRERSEDWQGFGTRERLDGTLLPLPDGYRERYDALYREGTDLERELLYWLVANELPVRALEASPVFKLVVYEQLAAEPERVVAELYAHCGLELGPSTRRFLEDSTRGAHQDDYYGVVKDAARVVDRWKRDLSAEQIDTVGRFLDGSLLSRHWS